MTPSRGASETNHETGKAELPLAMKTNASTLAAASTEPAEITTDSIAAMLVEALGDRFEILPPIAIGGMATIFQMRHRLDNGIFVAKVLHPHMAEDAEILAAFHREARHVAVLADHPGVVPIVDAGEGGGVHYLVMPYVEGEDLDVLLKRRGPFTREEALLLMAQMVSLLVYAEERGIVHGDLSPGNIRLDRFGLYRLLDFGLSRSAGNEMGSRLQRAATPAYASPEVSRGQVPDIRADLYSLGLILCEALTGKPLFASSDLAALPELHLKGDWTMPPEIEADAPVAALLRRLIVADRDKRIGSALELSGAMAALGVELLSFGSSLHQGELRPPRPRRRRLASLDSEPQAAPVA